MYSFQEELFTKVDDKNINVNEPMSKHTTFRIGGIADYYIRINSNEMLQNVIGLCKTYSVPFYIVGNGSNLLVGDGGFRGVIIEIASAMNEITCDGDIIYAQAGALLSRVARVALDQELGGFEFAAGIPGTIGGAVVMNAGAYGGEIKDVIVSATVLDTEGIIREWTQEELKLGYRRSAISSEGGIVVGVKIQLAKETKETIQRKMDELKEQRVTKQPLEYPSAGSTFKRPEGYFAAKLIDDTKLRGLQVGGAQVSEKHCGFVVNKGNATAADVCFLMSQVQEKVYKEHGVKLEPEIKKIGEF
ncbi:MAG: UDP-N-acetylmuramate dehydrogenase [Eubacteriales bacterium]